MKNSSLPQLHNSLIFLKEFSQAYPPLSYNSYPLLQVYLWPCHWHSILPQFSTSSSLTSLPTVLSHSHSIYVLIIPSHISYETLLLFILHDPSHFSLFSLFHIIISMYFRSSTLLPLVSSILLSSKKKSLTLVIPLALISCWQLKKSGGKHACLLTDSNFNLWPQILPGYSVLLDYLYTFIYICFSCSKIRLYHNFCISSNFHSLVQDAKHPLCTYFLALSVIRDGTCLLPPKRGRGHLLSNVFSTPRLFSWNIPSFH